VQTGVEKGGGYTKRETITSTVCKRKKKLHKVTRKGGRKRGPKKDKGTKRGEKDKRWRKKRVKSFGRLPKRILWEKKNTVGGGGKGTCTPSKKKEEKGGEKKRERGKWGFQEKWHFCLKTEIQKGEMVTTKTENTTKTLCWVWVIKNVECCPPGYGVGEIDYRSSTRGTKVADQKKQGSKNLGGECAPWRCSQTQRNGDNEKTRGRGSVLFVIRKR